MKKTLIFNIIGKILIFEAVVMVLPLFISFIYKERTIYKLSFVITMSVLASIGFFMNIKKAEDVAMKARDGFVIVALSWILMSALGALPFVISKDIPNYFDALFEISSGFSTTGASSIKDLSVISKSMLFWRSFSHWLGGMGILVLILSFIPESKDGSTIHIMRAESTGPQVGKLVSKVKITSRILYLIYLTITFIEFIFLLLGPDKNIGVYESILLSFSTAGTGGFAVLSSSVVTYSAYTQYVIGIFMLIFGTNFTIYYLLLIGKWKEVIKSEELKWYIITAALAIVLIMFSIRNLYSSFEEVFRLSFFQVFSVMSTSGFTAVDFAKEWPTLAKWTLILLMFTGCCAGSTGGGIKISRLVILVKTSWQNIRKMINPRRVSVVKYDGNVLTDDVSKSVQTFFITYIFITAIVTLLISIIEPDIDVLSNLTGTISCIGNVGPGLSMVGSYGDFSFYSSLSKLIFSLTMITGRLEIFPLIIALSPSTWRKK